MSASVSFILPYYRIEGMLLKRCLDSLLSLPSDIDYEVILVDDGTPETSVPAWLSEWQVPSCVRYFYQENKGLGGARNTGLSLATKEYVQFVDPDDYLFAERYAAVWSLLQEKQPDLLTFDFRKVYDCIRLPDAEGDTSVWFEGSGTAFMLQHNLRAGAWGYLFRRSLCRDLTFPEHTYHEDEAFTPQLYLRARVVVITDIPLYAYYQRQDSIMNSPKREKLHKRFTDLLGIQLGLSAQANQLPAEQQQALRRRIDQNYMSMLYKLFTDSPDQAFLQLYVRRMKKQGGYPLPLHGYTLKYILFACVTALPGVPALLWRLLAGRRH